MLVAACAGLSRAAPDPFTHLDLTNATATSTPVPVGAAVLDEPTPLLLAVAIADCAYADVGNDATILCDPGDQHFRCRTDADCAHHEYCEHWSGRCKPRSGGDRCRTDADCDMGEICNRWTGHCKPNPGGKLCRNDADCDDGSFCNGAEVCTVDGDCAMGPRPCDDGVACTIDACNEDTDVCEYIPSATCCNDGSFCNGTEVCDPVEGCVAGEPPLDCTAMDSFCGYGFCDENTRACMLEPTNEGTACDDGDPLCTLDDACTNGACIGTPVCDPQCERCDAGECTSLCGNPYARETDELDVMDCLYSLRAVVGLEECPPCICDVNGDGKVSVSDTLAMMHCAVGNAVEMSCPRP